MPRDANGNYAPPPNTAGIPGFTITADQFNTTVTDLGAEIAASATQGQLQGFSGAVATTGTGAAYVLTIAGIPSDLSKMLGLTFRAHATNVLADVTLTGTLTAGQSVIPDASSIGGLAVGQAITSALAATSFSGNVTQGQYAITNVSSTAGLSVGMPVTSGTTGLAAGTTIANISGTTVTLNQQWTGATATGLTFSATPGIQPNTTIQAIASTTSTAGVTTNTITLSQPIVGSTVVGATLTAPAATSRLTVNTSPTRSIVAPDGSALLGGEIIAGQIYSVFYNPALLAYVLDAIPGRLRLSATDPKAGYLSGKIFDSKGNPIQTATQNGQQVLILPDAGVAIGDFLNSGRNSPTGYLRRDGATYLQSAYPNLYALITQRFLTFNRNQATITNLSPAQFAYGAGVYVAVGSGSGGCAASSPDGSTWTMRDTTTQAQSAVVYAGGQFVTVGGRYTTSPDGLTWTARTGPAIANLRSIAYGSTRYVATSNSSTSTAYSSDGINWSTGTAPFAANAITYANGLFVIVGAAGKVATSPDGLTWTMRTSIDATTTWNAIIYANGLFVAVGDPTSSYGSIMTSPDALTWTARPINNLPASGTNPLQYFTSIVYTFGLFIALGSAGRFATSSDGINWRDYQNSYVSGQAYLSAFATAGLVLVAYNSSSTVTSTPYGDSFIGLTPKINTTTQFQVPADDPYLGYIRAL